MFNPLSLITSSPYALAIKAGLALLVVAGIFSAGSYTGHRWEHGEVLKLQLADAQNLTKAVQAASASKERQDAVALTAAIKEAQAQAQVVTNTITITKRIPTYVHDKVSCFGPTVGLARVLRAAAAGADPSALQLATGQSDDDCSDVTPSEVAGWFAPYAGASQANAEQLNALEAWILANHQAQVQP